MQPALLPLDAYGDGLGRAATVLRANAAAAGLEAPVPTCPGWTVLDLVSHQGMVHRWATGHLRGTPVEDPAALEREGREVPDVLGWFDEGATALLQAIVDAPDDVDAPVFLKAAPTPRLFWTRRQCHETTIHAVDAIGARLGRPARADETWVRETLALDGIDELLRGFLPRRRQGVHAPDDTLILVRPHGQEVGWLLAVHPEDPVETTPVDLRSATPPAADHVLAGDPVELYLQLWNRGPEPPDLAADSVEAWWRGHVTVSWA